MSQLRILLLAPDANPESISVALVCYSHAEALAKIHSVTLVGRSTNDAPLRSKKTPFHTIETISMPWLDRILEWSMRWIFRGNFHSRALTAFLYPFSIAFELHAWRKFRRRIRAGEFDVILRLSPVVCVIPSAFPFLLRNLSVPFIIGPINGGLPWPKEFSQADNQRGWIDNLRNVYRILPFSRSTYRRAAAIIAGSSQTYSEFVDYRDKMFFLPENGVNESLCSSAERREENGGKLEFIFVGALVPYKACDLALRGATPFLKQGLARFTIVGDGPERGRLEQLTDSLGIREAVSFCGMVSHSEAMKRLRAADVLVFPSVREFGGGVVFEALAVGAVPVVADFGGPGDIVQPGVGRKVSLTNETDVVSQLENVLSELVHDRNLLDQLRQQGMTYARESLTWDAKAQAVTKVLQWVLRRGPKPEFLPPKALAANLVPSCKNAAPAAGAAV